MTTQIWALLGAGIATAFLLDSWVSATLPLLPVHEPCQHANRQVLQPAQGSHDHRRL